MKNFNCRPFFSVFFLLRGPIRKFGSWRSAAVVDKGQPAKERRAGAGRGLTGLRRMSLSGHYSRGSRDSLSPYQRDQESDKHAASFHQRMLSVLTDRGRIKKGRRTYTNKRRAKVIRDWKTPEAPQIEFPRNTRLRRGFLIGVQNGDIGAFGK
jgi:hypothetical protein